MLKNNRLSKLLSAKPVCFNHNLETVKRLQKEVRRGATYQRSLDLLKMASETDMKETIFILQGVISELHKKNLELKDENKKLRTAISENKLLTDTTNVLSKLIYCVLKL